MDQIFHRLLTTAAPSGYEGAVQEVYKELMTPYVDSIETDTMGNVMAVKKGPEGSPKVMLTAHPIFMASTLINSIKSLSVSTITLRVRATSYRL